MKPGVVIDADLVADHHGIEERVAAVPGVDLVDVLVPLIVEPRGPRTFVADIWKDYDQPTAAADFALRKQVTFYGMRAGPHISVARSPLLYQQLAQIKCGADAAGDDK